MLGLAMLFFVVLYLLLSVLIVRGSIRIARRYNIEGWKLGVPAALLMYLIVFWDHIPTLVMHKYYCETEAGFWVYKTPEQWAKENPGVLETLRPWPRSRIYGTDKVEFELNDGMVDQYNDRFGYWRKANQMFHGIKLYQSESGIIDVKSHELITHRISFSSGPGGAGMVGKFWLRRDTCDENQARKDRKIHLKIISQLQIKE